MDTPEKLLEQILQSKINLIKEKCTPEDAIYTLIEIIRSLDYNTFMLSHDDNPNKRQQLIHDRYRYGWALPFILLYENLNVEEVPIFPSTKETAFWVDSLIQHAGSLQLCRMLIDFKKANLANLEKLNQSTFAFTYFYNSSEYYEKLSLEHYHGLIAKQLESVSKRVMEKLLKMRKELESVVNPIGDFISYHATDEMDNFYSEFANVYMLTRHTVDEYGMTDRFGGYEYKDYLEIAEYIFKCGIMHRDCCMALAEKTSHKTWLRNILTYGFSLAGFITSISEDLEWQAEKVKVILSCFTLTKENYLYHINYPKASPPPYIQVSHDMYIRSSYGCLDRPIFFLNKELQRKFPKDVSNARNNREIRFKNELYGLFNQERILKVQQNIKVKLDGINTATDIDAVLFDKEKNVIALFQLKWHATFYTSMKERRSRITNFISESTDWINKVEKWIERNDSKTILNNCTINLKSATIEKVYLFVIARSHANFTNQNFDERATWASWYQIIEAVSNVQDETDENPIESFKSKVDFYSPASRAQRGEVLNNQGYEFTFDEYKIIVNSKS